MKMEKSRKLMMKRKHLEKQKVFRADKIIYLKTIRLGFLNIGEITNLEIFEALHSLFLEYNKIKVIKGLDRNVGL